MPLCLLFLRGVFAAQKEGFLVIYLHEETGEQALADVGVVVLAVEVCALELQAETAHDAHQLPKGKKISNKLRVQCASLYDSFYKKMKKN